MAYIGNPPAPQNITSSEITDGTIVNVDIASDAAIAVSKISGLGTAATTAATAYATAAQGTVAANALPKAGGTMSGDIDGNGAKVLFSNMYPATGDLPNASTYHGMFAHVHGTGKGYFAHSNAWVPLANDADLTTTTTTANAALPKAGGAVTGNVTFGDNDKIIMGAGSDLQIFHEASNSYIKEVGAGDLIIMGDSVNIRNAAFEYALKYDTNAAVTLYYDNAAKIATSALGCDITGELIADSYNETYAAVTSASNATTVNCHAGNSFSHVLTENTTFTFSNPPASGTAYTFSIEIIQDSGASGFAVTWPSSVDWPAATAPTLTATASAKDIFVFTTRDGGTNWYGFTAALALG